MKIPHKTTQSTRFSLYNLSGAQKLCCLIKVSSYMAVNGGISEIFAMELFSATLHLADSALSVT